MVYILCILTRPGHLPLWPLENCDQRAGNEGLSYDGTFKTSIADHDLSLLSPTELSLNGSGGHFAALCSALRQIAVFC